MSLRCFDKTDLFWSGLFSGLGPSTLGSLKAVIGGVKKGNGGLLGIIGEQIKIQVPWQGSKILHKSWSNAIGGSSSTGGNDCGC